MKYFGLTEALPWPQEGVDDNSTPQTYRNTPWSSLNLSLSDDGNVSKGQTTLGKMVEDPQSDVREPVMETRNQGCVTNMVRAGTDITKYGRGTTEEADRSEDDKIDHERQAGGTPFSPRYGNIFFLDRDPANTEIGGEPFKVDNGHQNEPVRQTIGLRKGTKESTGPISDNTIPKDIVIQENELKGGWPEEGNKDTSAGGILETEQPPSREETHMPGEPKSTKQG